jgi:hypothetical protein
VSEKQIPQVVENIESRTYRMEPLEGKAVRPRQVRYQAALRPDFFPNRRITEQSCVFHLPIRPLSAPLDPLPPSVGARVAAVGTLPLHGGVAHGIETPWTHLVPSEVIDGHPYERST